MRLLRWLLTPVRWLFDPLLDARQDESISVLAALSLQVTTALVQHLKEAEIMSQSLDRLKSAVAALASRVAVLESSPLTTGTPDAELDIITAEIEAIALKPRE